MHAQADGVTWTAPTFLPHYIYLVFSKQEELIMETCLHSLVEDYTVLTHHSPSRLLPQADQTWHACQE